MANTKSLLMLVRTKHIGIRYLWFRSKIQSNEIVVQFNIIMRSNSCNGLPIAIIYESVALDKLTNSAPGVHQYIHTFFPLRQIIHLLIYLILQPPEGYHHGTVSRQLQALGVQFLVNLFLVVFLTIQGNLRVVHR